MGNLFAELKRRHIYRVAAAYAVVAWVLLQLVNNVAPVLDLPVWVARAFLLALAIGFPVAIFLAWVRELAPADGTTVLATTGKLDWVLIGALVVVIALVSYQQLAPATGERAAQQQQVATAPTAPPAPQTAGISIAVLPFVNLSGDAGQEFFSDGMTEEITAALAQVPGLRVLGRTSAFEFKGQNKDLRTIGQALGATHLIEGSVRKAGNRVRITAQLVKVDDDSHLWAQNYDRELTDVFAIQEDIAQSIAASLRVPLGLQPGDTLVRNQTKDLDSYEQYLHAKALVRARGTANDEAITLLEKVVGRDPQFAPAWALLAYAYALTPANSGSFRLGAIEDARRIFQTYLDKAEAASRKAIQLDSRHAGGYVALAYTQAIHGKWAAAEDTFKQALALDPNDPEALHEYSVVLAVVGRIKTSLSMREKLLTLEPFVPIFKINTAIYREFAGRAASAIQLLEPLPPNVAANSGRNTTLAHAYAMEGRYTEGADTLLLTTNSTIPRRTVEDAARILRTAPAKTKAPDSLPAVDTLNFVYAYVGALDRVMDYPERLLSIGYSLGGTLWFPEYAPVRKTERFKSYMRKAGLVDYWRARGWPDRCRPMGADDFVCD